MADVLEESVATPLNLLLKAKSKDIVRNLIEDGFLYRASNVPSSVVKAASGLLSVELSEAEELMNSIVTLVQVTLYHSTADPQEISKVFPDGFHKNLRDLLSRIIAEKIQSWRSSSINDQVSLPHLLDFDWRVDVKTSSDAITRMSIPTCIMQLKVEENAKCKEAMPTLHCVNVELTKEKLDTVLDGLGKIRDQLSSVAK
ncbi:COMM domain-containing protein 9 [Exaiptasia diaphana]|uniref:COMM domain-containing protein n=1 Tax=Exaiptasia diaphana TaxID=2652724 RepID=A0A913WSZ4_EXADI|nr:COMM domain-containing protein 9 [Exaiptasia diaphana]KXJ18130.1 COMM domain-containing protein 9 [Exaiptasia diaphana]